jgi:hypothetical protein
MDALDEFENSTDYAEYLAVCAGIIQAFEERLYALYLLGKFDPSEITMTLDLLREYITFGPERAQLDIGALYILLPRVVDKQAKDPDAVMGAVNEMMKNLRGPFFVDLKTNEDNSVIAQGSYLVDAVALNPPNLDLILDPRMGSGCPKGNCNISLPLPCADSIIRKQLMKAFR